MKKLVLAASLVVFGSAAASAADMAPRYYKAPPPVVSPLFDWSGFYAGINGGWGTSHNCWTRTGGVGAVAAEGCHDADGGTVGGQIGYRWQAQNWVFGLEAQGNWADFSGSNTTFVGGNPIGGAQDRTRIDAFGLFTGQVGYAWNNVLAYVKGGAAVVDYKYDMFATPGGLIVSSNNETRWGGTVGAGLEIGFAPNWSVAFEYDHIFLDDSNPTLTAVGVGGVTNNFHIRSDVDMGTVRVNYRFGGPVVAKY
jgi:outer membrane immunogenic protein